MLKQTLNEKIKKSSLEDLKEKLGYQSTKKLQNSIGRFIEIDTINNWLNSSFYDLVNNAEDFLVKLCKVFDIDEKLLQDEMENNKKLKMEIAKFKDSYIFVNTNFKRESQPIFVLALMEKRRRISLYKNEQVLFKTVDEIIKRVSYFVVEHYKINDGKCYIWENIVNYQLHLFGELYTFSKDGELIDEKKNLDVNIASLSVK